MQIGLVGLGKMGANMAQRLIRGGHDVQVFDIDPAAVKALEKLGAKGTKSLAELAANLSGSRVVWVMVPAGEATEKTILEVASHLGAGDIVIDGGNSFYQDDLRRALALAKTGVELVDVGTSGGVWGLERGYCLMIGGSQVAFQACEPIFKTLAPGRGEILATKGRKKQSTADEGYLHCGPVGCGHFVKMIHNGIEYGLMQAYAEGFQILKGAAQDSIPEARRYKLDLAEIAEVWRRGSVVGSWLLDLTAEALAESPELKEFSGQVQDSGEGRWTLDAAIEQAMPAEILASSLFARFRSRMKENFANKMLSAMRNKFGGHVEK